MVSLEDAIGNLLSNYPPVEGFGDEGWRALAGFTDALQAELKRLGERIDSLQDLSVERITALEVPEDHVLVFRYPRDLPPEELDKVFEILETVFVGEQKGPPRQIICLPDEIEMQAVPQGKLEKP